MEKNENGYPMAEREGGMSRSAPNPNGKANTPQNSTAPNPGNSDNGRIRGGDCGESANYVDNLPLAYVYAPMQRFCMLYSAEDALDHGTLFEALYKPKEVYGRE